MSQIKMSLKQIKESEKRKSMTKIKNNINEFEERSVMLTWYLLIHAGIRNTFGWMDFE